MGATRHADCDSCIDVSPTACRVMAKRLRDVCKLCEDEPLWAAGRAFVVRDLSWAEERQRQLPPFEFENWAVIALGGIRNKTGVADMGIDGRIFPIRHSEFAIRRQSPPTENRQLKTDNSRPSIPHGRARFRPPPLPPPGAIYERAVVKPERAFGGVSQPSIRRRRNGRAI